MKLRALTLTAVILVAVSLRAQNSDRNALPAFSSNWGAKIGFAATASYITDANIDGHQLTEYIQDTQVGNFAALLFRLNSRTIFVQSGIGFNYNRSCFYMDMNAWNPEADSRNDLTCQFTFKSISAPLQMGYHIVNRPPYCMSAYTGPRLRYTPDNYYKVQFQNLEPYEFTETPTELVMGWTAGLSINIGRTFLDFEYEATINTVTGPMIDMSGADPAPNYKLNRRIGIMSFSYGIIF